MTSHKGMRIRCMWIMSALAVCAFCFGQTPSATTPDLPTRSDIIVPVNVVIAPTTVLDKSGNYVNGLTIDDFKLFDNGKPQRITQDVAFEPISLVIAVQASSMLGDILPKIQTTGVMISNLVVGQNGEAAVMAFDHRIRTLQDFTDDAGKIQAAMKSINPGSSSSRMIDTVVEAVRMLKVRPLSRRRVILLISEKRDKASEGRLRDALTAAQFANVAIYSIDISHLMAQFTGKAEPPRPNPIPATANHMPPGAVQTPTTVDIQQNSGNAIPLFVEIFKATKSLFVDDTLDVFTRYTGGKEYSFVSHKSLEKAVTAVGEEIHSQYLLSYTPSNLDEGGFHEIRVEVNRPRLEVRTRPGYWVAARP
jgi:VWFA-related protein